MIRKAYRAKEVNRVSLDQISEDRKGIGLRVGCDVAKYWIMVVLRWADGRFERPWKVGNPDELIALSSLLRKLNEGREMVVALESTGTYGDALRQALSDAGLTVHRVSSKAAADYAETFDGVPSQHDGKDAAVIAELSAMGHSVAWPYTPAEMADQELAYWVDRIDVQQKILSTWMGRVEALLARHWPEATRTLPLRRATLWQILKHYGGPSEMACDPRADEHLAKWGGHLLGADTRAKVLQAARTTAGVRQTAFDARQMREYAAAGWEARQEIRRCKRALERLARENSVLTAQAEAIGLATACVLWVHLGNPEDYHCAAAYRKAMGLNLKERSSGRYQGQLKISKRGAAIVRRWLYFAVLRLVYRHASIAVWYQRQKEQHGNRAKRALIGVMRRLAMALYRIVVDKQPFEARRLFPGRRRNRRRTAAGRRP